MPWVPWGPFSYEDPALAALPLLVGKKTKTSGTQGRAITENSHFTNRVILIRK